MTGHPVAAQQPTVGAIWAQTPEGVIGRDGTIPWHVPEDLRFFAATTTGHPVIMGRRTWESFPEKFRPLPHRANIVVTTQPERIPADGRTVWTASSYAEALDLARSLPGEPPGEIWVIGGPRLWAEARAHEPLPLTRAVVTTVELSVAGDTHAPALDESWHRSEVADWAVSRTGTRFRMDDYTR